MRTDSLNPFFNRCFKRLYQAIGASIREYFSKGRLSNCRSSVRLRHVSLTQGRKSRTLRHLSELTYAPNFTALIEDGKSLYLRCAVTSTLLMTTEDEAWQGSDDHSPPLTRCQRPIQSLRTLQRSLQGRPGRVGYRRFETWENEGSHSTL